MILQSLGGAARSHLVTESHSKALPLALPDLLHTCGESCSKRSGNWRSLHAAFPRQEYRNRLPFPPPEDLLDARMEPASLWLLHFRWILYPLSHQESHVLPTQPFRKCSLPSPQRRRCSRCDSASRRGGSFVETPQAHERRERLSSGYR